jgi:hypothetical protein
VLVAPDSQFVAKIEHARPRAGTSDLTTCFVWHISALYYTWFTYSDKSGGLVSPPSTGCDIRLVTGTGPWENSGPAYRMSEVLRNRGIAHHLDDWGPEGGHEWPYWHHQMWEYVGAHF